MDQLNLYDIYITWPSVIALIFVMVNLLKLTTYAYVCIKHVRVMKTTNKPTGATFKWSKPNWCKTIGSTSQGNRRKKKWTMILIIPGIQYITTFSMVAPYQISSSTTPSSSSTVLSSTIPGQATSSSANFSPRSTSSSAPVCRSQSGSWQMPMECPSYGVASLGYSSLLFSSLARKSRKQMFSYAP